MKVGMICLGCAKNLVDGEMMLGHLKRWGIEVTPLQDEADVLIVNTCGFIVPAKEESIGVMLDAVEQKRSGNVERVIVAGCMAQRYAEELAAEIPEIDVFLGLDELEDVLVAISGGLDGHRPEQRGAVRVYGADRPRVVSTMPYAYLKVAEGCDHACSFCHIPRMRGRFRSRQIDDLVLEARGLEASGARELILIAQDTTGYGRDIGLDHGLRDLLTALLNETDLPWIRFLYAYPTTLDAGVLDLMAKSERLVPYLDLPLQHVSRPVLRAMRRGGDGASFSRIIERARDRVPDLAVRTTFLVGFPGEGTSEFNQLLSFVEKTEFDHVGVFCYSWQEENPGADLGDPVPESVKKQRADRLLELQQGISLRNNRRLVGRTVSVLVSGLLPEMELLTEARLPQQAPDVDGRVLINDGTAEAGSFVEVEVTEAHPYDVVGRLLRVPCGVGENGNG